MAPSSEISPLIKSPVPEKLPFPLGLVSPGVRPYLELIRFHKPTGTVLMFWPFAWGLTMAAYHTSLDLTTFWAEMFKFLIAAFIVRGSACTINDIFDRDFDAGVGTLRLIRYRGSYLTSFQSVPRDALLPAVACQFLLPLSI
jgi:4-hydroxybenzoate polyprenyltransferase